MAHDVLEVKGLEDCSPCCLADAHIRSAPVHLEAVICFVVLLKSFV